MDPEITLQDRQLDGDGIEGSISDPGLLPASALPGAKKRSSARSRKPKGTATRAAGTANGAATGEWGKYPGPYASGDGAPGTSTSSDGLGAESSENPEIVVDAPEAEAPGAPPFGILGSFLDGIANRFTSSGSSPAKLKAAQEDADFYLFIAETVIASQTIKLGYIPASEQEHKLMVLGLADVIRSDGRMTKIARNLHWVALPVGAGLWGLRIVTAYLTLRDQKARAARKAQEQSAQAQQAPIYVPTPQASGGAESLTSAELQRLFDLQPSQNGLEHGYGADPSIFGS